MSKWLHWAIHNAASDHTPEELKTIVFAHLADHSDHYEALSDLLSSKTDVDTLAQGLVEHGCSELVGEVIEFFLVEA